MNEEDIYKVLALFDKEDIPYINFEYLVNRRIIESNMIKKNIKSHIRIKKRGGKNDRSGK